MQDVPQSFAKRLDSMQEFLAPPFIVTLSTSKRIFSANTLPRFERSTTNDRVVGLS